MAANRQQAIYLISFIVAFTTLPAGLISLVYHWTFVGIVLTLAAVLILAYSLFGLRRIKGLEFSKE